MFHIFITSMPRCVQAKCGRCRRRLQVYRCRYRAPLSPHRSLSSVPLSRCATHCCTLYGRETAPHRAPPAWQLQPKPCRTLRDRRLYASMPMAPATDQAQACRQSRDRSQSTKTLRSRVSSPPHWPYWLSRRVHHQPRYALAYTAIHSARPLYQWIFKDVLP